MCVARKAQGDRTVPTDALNLAPAACRRKASATCPATRGRLPAADLSRTDQMALSIIWVSWPLLTAPIWVASTLPFLNTIRVGMPRTP
jgi:hypothetical protein